MILVMSVCPSGFFLFCHGIAQRMVGHKLKYLLVLYHSINLTMQGYPGPSPSPLVICGGEDWRLEICSLENPSPMGERAVRNLVESFLVRLCFRISS